MLVWKKERINIISAYTSELVLIAKAEVKFCEDINFLIQGISGDQ